MNYFGMELSYDRKSLAKDAKTKCQKFMNFIKVKIQTNDEGLRKTMHEAFHRSLLIYFLTPLYAAGAINKEKISSWKQK